MKREDEIRNKAYELGQKYFPNANNVWARANIEAKYVSSACTEMAEWMQKKMIDKACKWMEWIRQCGSYYGTNITKESIRDFRKTMESSEESVLDYIKLED